MKRSSGHESVGRPQSLDLMQQSLGTRTQTAVRAKQSAKPFTHMAHELPDDAIC